jgi:hypothetical protein
MYVHYCRRHSMINACDRCITLLSNTDISFALSINLYSYKMYFLMPFGWYRVTLEIQKIHVYIKQNKRYIHISDYNYVYHSHLLCHVSVVTQKSTQYKAHEIQMVVKSRRSILHHAEILLFHLFYKLHLLLLSIWSKQK